MDLSLDGYKVERVDIDFTVRLVAEGQPILTIEGPIQVTGTGGQFTVALGEDDLSGDGRLDFVVGATIVSSSSDVGRLAIVMDDGTRLSVEPDPDFESWTAYGRDGKVRVGLPGGTTTTFG